MTTAESSFRHRPSRIVFGSCNSQYLDQPLWPRIEERNAAAFVWGGDAIYGDSTAYDHSKGRSVIPATPSVLAEAYKKQRDLASYRQAILDNPTIKVFGTIDDHDYGIDNGDKTYPYRNESAILFVESFLQEDNDSLLMKRAKRGDGVYAVKLLDFSRPVGQELVPEDHAGIDPEAAAAVSSSSSSEDETTAPTYSTTHSVAVFLVDVRSNKTPYKTGSFLEKYLPDYDGDFLGDKQWQWLEGALARSKATVNVVVNGLQVHADKFPTAEVAESWSRFPTAQHRLYQALLQSNVRNPILISGDVHHAQLLRKDCLPIDKAHDTKASAAGSGGLSETPRPLMEMTTSGMTHSWGTNLCSRSASAFPCGNPYFKFFTKTAMNIAHWMTPWTELMRSDTALEDGAKTGMQYELGLNYGELEFDWDEEIVYGRIRGVHPNRSSLAAKWTFSQLNGTEPETTPIARGSSVNLNAKDFNFIRERLPTTAQPNDWVCVGYRGSVHPYYLNGTTFFALGIVITIGCAPFLATLLSAVILRHVLTKPTKR